MARGQTPERKMSREEAGRLGGKATSRNHDRSFYQTIGKKVEKPLQMLMMQNSTRKSDAKAEKLLLKTIAKNFIARLGAKAEAVKLSLLIKRHIRIRSIHAFVEIWKPNSMSME